MNILCISASNTKRMGESSTSTNVCHLIKAVVSKEHDVSVLPLMDYDVKPCILCGDCFRDQKCIYDHYFNQIYEHISKSEVIFLVVPHYSPIPSKLLIILEKINEIAYASWIHDPKFESPFSKIKVGIIGHGGMAENEEVIKYYHDHLITPIANTLRSLSFHVIGENEVYPNGTAFGLKSEDCIVKKEGTIFPDIIQDYEMIKKRIEPLISHVMNT